MREAERVLVLESAWLNRALEGAAGWPHGAVRVVSATRIGTDYGLSGRSQRVDVETERGGRRSLVVKEESAEAVERELLFRRQCGELLHGCIADLYGGETDAESGRGVLLLEDIAPAEQGDVLRGCSDEQAAAVMRVFARIHAAPWSEEAPRWEARPLQPDRWLDRVTRAGERFPAILTESRRARLRDLPGRVAAAGEELRHRPVSWIQVDAHLDNTLFRPDGSVVLLDWCNAAIGPPVVDLARFLTEGVVPASQPGRVTALLSVYAREVGEEVAELEGGFALAQLPFLQGVVGWAGRDDLELQGRSAALCEGALRCVCDWVLGDGA